MLSQERRLEIPVKPPQNKARWLRNRAADVMARAALGAILLTGCLRGEQKPPSPTVPDNISSEEPLLTPGQMGQWALSEVYPRPPKPRGINQDIEKARMSSNERAWEIRGIRDLRLILNESINPAFQDPSLMEQLGQDLTPLSDINLVRLQRGLRYFYAGSGRFSGWETTETEWNFSLKGVQGPYVFVHAYNETFPDGSAGKLRRFTISVDLANYAVPELRPFIEKINDRSRELNLSMLKEAALEFFQLPADLQWEIPEGKRYDRPAGTMLGRGTSLRGENVLVQVRPDGTAKLKVVRNP